MVQTLQAMLAEQAKAAADERNLHAHVFHDAFVEDYPARFYGSTPLVCIVWRF
jgi:hypothetical protein